MFYSEIHSEMDGGPRWTRRRLGDRMRDAVDLAIAVLLLEDDYDVDWQLPEEFERVAATPRRARSHARQRSSTGTALGRRHRRPGTVAGKPQPCLSPIRRRIDDPRHQVRAR